jgi:hypothetical protein
MRRHSHDARGEDPEEQKAQEGRGSVEAQPAFVGTALAAGSKALESRARSLVTGARAQRQEGMTRPGKPGTAPRRGTNPWRANPGRGSGMKQAREGRWRRKPSRTWETSGTERDRGVGIPCGVVDAACRCRDEGRGPHGRRSSAGRLDRKTQSGTKGSAQAVALWRRRKARGRMKPHRKMGRTADEETPRRARAKSRGRGGSGEAQRPRNSSAYNTPGSTGPS